MADPLSISASILSILDLAGKVIGYLRMAKGASSERGRLLTELAGLRGILELLNDQASDATIGLSNLGSPEAARDTNQDASWSLTVQSLTRHNGPLQEFKDLLELLYSQLQARQRLQKVKTAFIWPFKREHCMEIFRSLERYKSLFTLAIQNDHL